MKMNWSDMKTLPRRSERDGEYLLGFGFVFPDEFVGEAEDPEAPPRFISGGWTRAGVTVFRDRDGSLYAVPCEVFTGCSG